MVPASCDLLGYIESSYKVRARQNLQSETVDRIKHHSSHLLHDAGCLMVSEDGAAGSILKAMAAVVVDAMNSSMVRYLLALLTVSMPIMPVSKTLELEVQRCHMGSTHLRSTCEEVDDAPL